MRADVEPGAHDIAIAIQHQRFAVAGQGRLDFGEAAVAQLIKPQQFDRLCTIGRFVCRTVV